MMFRIDSEVMDACRPRLIRDRVWKELIRTLPRDRNIPIARVPTKGSNAEVVD